MPIVKVDPRGRISLKKVMKEIAPYYIVTTDGFGEKIILKPAYDEDADNALSKENAEKIKVVVENLLKEYENNYEME